MTIATSTIHRLTLAALDDGDSFPQRVHVCQTCGALFAESTNYDGSPCFVSIRPGREGVHSREDVVKV